MGYGPLIQGRYISQARCHIELNLDSDDHTDKSGKKPTPIIILQSTPTLHSLYTYSTTTQVGIQYNFSCI